MGLACKPAFSENIIFFFWSQNYLLMLSYSFLETFAEDPLKIWMVLIFLRSKANYTIFPEFYRFNIYDVIVTSQFPLKMLWLIWTEGPKTIYTYQIQHHRTQCRKSGGGGGFVQPLFKKRWRILDTIKFLTSSVKPLLISVNNVVSFIFHENDFENNQIVLKLQVFKMNFIFVHEHVNVH